MFNFHNKEDYGLFKISNLFTKNSANNIFNKILCKYRTKSGFCIKICLNLSTFNY